MASKTRSSVLLAGVWLAFVGKLLRIDFHFNNVLCFDLDTWDLGFAWVGPGALTRGAGQARAGMGESGRAPIEGLLLGMGTWGIRGRGRRWCLGLWPITPDVSATGGRACRWLGTAKPAPGGVAHWERRRGLGSDVEGMGACRLEGVPETCFWG